MGWPGGSWQSTATLAGTITAFYLAALWLTIVIWTNRDIRARTHEIAAHTLATVGILVTGFVGLPLYLILRPRTTLADSEARQLEDAALYAEIGAAPACDACDNAIEPDFLVCPHCANPLRGPCHACKRPLRHGWIACPYCAVAVTHAPRRATASRPTTSAPLDSTVSRLSALASDLGLPNEEPREPRRRP
ncbi:MAG: zinc ribbon domain-containing protein [Dehalococcoidia bacterium]|nr:zinc ribbon domain-containing protein [Dehalococcoidia bacterium]